MVTIEFFAGVDSILVILPVLDYFVDFFSQINYAQGFFLFVVLSMICNMIVLVLKVYGTEASESVD